MRKFINVIKSYLKFYPPFNQSNPFIAHKFLLKENNINISDFFLFRLDGVETKFIGENNLALLLAKKIECTHVFYFFNQSGNKIGEFSENSDNFHFELDITSNMVGGEVLGGFIHQTKYSKSILDKYRDTWKNCIFQHRGYS